MLTVVTDATAGSIGLPAGATAHEIRWDAEPSRDEVRALVKGLDDDDLLVHGSAATLNFVVEGLRRGARLDVPIAFLPGKPRSTSDTTTYDLAEVLSLPSTIEGLLKAEPVALPLARNDIGGVMLYEADFSADRGKTFGAQAYHDDELIADGLIRRIDVRVDYSATNVLRSTVTPTSGRKRTAGARGRAVQIACDPVPMSVDGREPVEVDGRTWYLDDREHWLLRGARLPSAPAERAPGGWWRRLLGR